jgi:hypothetical protein
MRSRTALLHPKFSILKIIYGAVYSFLKLAEMKEMKRE